MIPSDFDEARICVVMLTLNQRERTLTCLQNLVELEGPPLNIVVWDNGSEDGTVEAVREAFPDAVAHHHPVNLGVAPGRNAAAELALRSVSPTHFLFLDNDMRMEPNFVVELLKPFLQDPTVGQTQAKLRFMDEPQRLNDGGGANITFWLGRTVPVGYGEIDEGQYDYVRPCVACGGAMMVRRDVYEELGGFDNVFGKLGPDDLDFSLRISRAGYKALFVPTAVAYHKVSHTYGGDYGEAYARLKSHNWFIFMRRHAPWHQQLAFYLIGIPYLVLAVMIRESRRGNFGAIRGLILGAVDFLRTLRGQGRDLPTSG